MTRSTGAVQATFARKGNRCLQRCAAGHRPALRAKMRMAAASGYNIDMDHVIPRLEGSRVFIDAPVTCAIDRGYTNGTIRKYTWSGRIQNSGVEYIRGVLPQTEASVLERMFSFAG